MSPLALETGAKTAIGQQFRVTFRDATSDVNTIFSTECKREIARNLAQNFEEEMHRF